MYSVKEIYLTLQGEGMQSGRRAVFCRFAGCNLWTGREQDRANAVCQFCDTDFIGTDGPGGGQYESSEDLAKACLGFWGVQNSARPLVVLTGGEPMLQVDGALIEALHAAGFEIAIESNGTLAVPRSIDWICISPKAGAELVQKSGDELKLVYPQDGIAPGDVAGLDFKNFLLQPMDGDARYENTQAALAFCLENPGWRLSLQTHKLIGIA
ncbi:MAG: 7-carboxy-7-deazaguanine synthase [Alphaproteobacteria bacterium]